jgi:hypothetical protein
LSVTVNCVSFYACRNIECMKVSNNGHPAIPLWNFGVGYYHYALLPKNDTLFS